jgi:hypothetical protein
MKRIFDKYWKTALFTVIGAGLGFAYWRFVGCSSGTCPLTANWHTSTLMGGLIGMLATPSRKKTDTGNVSGEATEETQSSKPDQTENKS